ncbi:hypothetical protein BDZ91DRAFT_803065 [Kalaharituber pfeilii]|nr:hypothetical protein BDZ91DRAFT_803065 [Kalaharituber pfeilii]
MPPPRAAPTGNPAFTSSGSTLGKAQQYYPCPYCPADLPTLERLRDHQMSLRHCYCIRCGKFSATALAHDDHMRQKHGAQIIFNDSAVGAVSASGDDTKLKHPGGGGEESDKPDINNHARAAVGEGLEDSKVPGPIEVRFAQGEVERMAGAIAVRLYQLQSNPTSSQQTQPNTTKKFENDTAPAERPVSSIMPKSSPSSQPPNYSQTTLAITSSTLASNPCPQPAPSNLLRYLQNASQIPSLASESYGRQSTFACATTAQPLLHRPAMEAQKQLGDNAPLGIVDSGVSQARTPATINSIISALTAPEPAETHGPHPVAPAKRPMRLNDHTARPTNPTVLTLGPSYISNMARKDILAVVTQPPYYPSKIRKMNPSDAKVLAGSSASRGPVADTPLQQVPALVAESTGQVACAVNLNDTQRDHRTTPKHLSHTDPKTKLTEKTEKGETNATGNASVGVKVKSEPLGPES